MATSSAVRFQVIDAGARRVVAVSPASRPDLHLPQAHPRRPVSAGRVGAVASCAAARPARPQPLLRLKVAAVAVLALAGGVVSVQQFAAMAQPDPAVEYVAGDPGWAHVTQP